MKRVTAELGLAIPDYVTNREVYAAVDRASQVMEEQAHISTENAVIHGLDFDQNEDESTSDFPKGEAA